MALLLGMPALHCVGLRLVVFCDAGMAALAEVLPQMEHLSALGLREHDIPVELLAQIVSIASSARARGVRGLRQDGLALRRRLPSSRAA